MAELNARSFDFWLGEWDCVFEDGHAVNTVTTEFGGQVMTERFVMDAPQLWNGMSVSVFNEGLTLWRQTWVDDDGSYWHFVGGLVDGDPSFGTPVPVDQPPLYKRMVFTNITTNGFNWRWESSPDGHEWTENWAIEYRRRS